MGWMPTPIEASVWPSLWTLEKKKQTKYEPNYKEQLFDFHTGYIGSAVMSPMIFEKSLSMSQNLHIQKGEHIDNHYMLIVDLAKSSWDWSKGEPPITNPAYYLRYLKTFNRMGGTMKYLSADNRDFLLALYQRLHKI